MRLDLRREPSDLRLEPSDLRLELLCDAGDRLPQLRDSRPVYCAINMQVACDIDIATKKASVTCLPFFLAENRCPCASRIKIESSDRCHPRRMCFCMYPFAILASSEYARPISRRFSEDSCS